jgi:hypothetical protein
MTFLTVILAITAGTVTTSMVIPVAVAALTATVTLLLARAAEAANRRRDQYAAAVATLVAWIEFPYRVRRRTANDASTLTALAGIGHDLQERLASHQAWIATESSDVAEVYTKARAAISGRVGVALNQAWATDAMVAKPEDMNLGDWGPAKACASDIADVQRSIITRFGWERFKSHMFGWRC